MTSAARARLEARAAQWASWLVEEGWPPDRATLRARRAYGLAPTPEKSPVTEFETIEWPLPVELRRAMVATYAPARCAMDSERTPEEHAAAHKREVRRRRRYVRNAQRRDANAST